MSALCIVTPYWHQACFALSHERTRNGLFNVAGLRCGLRPKRSDDLEQSLSVICPVYRLDPGLGKEQERKFAMFATSNEKKARKRVDPAIEGQNGATIRKSVRLARRRRLQTRGDRPFNILGCFALLHAIRSINSGGAALHIEPAAALKHLSIARS
jgi:hypothetical protein